jgi:hypothetical protein
VRLDGGWQTHVPLGKPRVNLSSKWRGSPSPLGTEVSRSKAMWMRSCAICKELLKKLRLSDSLRCKCGWEW